MSIFEFTVSIEEAERRELWLGAMNALRDAYENITDEYDEISRYPQDLSGWLWTMAYYPYRMARPAGLPLTVQLSDDERHVLHRGLLGHMMGCSEALYQNHVTFKVVTSKGEGWDAFYIFLSNGRVEVTREIDETPGFY